jgi:N-dimethylarginine dimethylaminohydrolase
MCPPDYYGIEYEINPWMNRARQADHPLAVEQWQGLYQAILATGADVELLNPVPGLPDLVFTANAALIFRRQAILSRFRHPQRQGEEPFDRAWLNDRGFEVLDAPSSQSFEGAGDALFCGDTLWAGYRMRSDALGHQQIAAMLGVRVIPVELVDAHYYHLDTCFCPLSQDQAIYYPAAFDEYGRTAIAQHVPGLIEVNRDEAARFACNAVIIGHTVITNTGCDGLHEKLRDRGFNTVATPLSEFAKAGGSAKCLTLRLDGEEAAQWKHALQDKP